MMPWSMSLCVVSMCVCVNVVERKEKGRLCVCYRLCACGCVRVVVCVFVCLRMFLSVCLCLYAALTGSERCAGIVLRRVIMHNLWRVHTGALWVFLFVLSISFAFLFFSSRSHEWNIKCTSVACARLKRAFICILGLMLVGNVITSLDSIDTCFWY